MLTVISNNKSKQNSKIKSYASSNPARSRTNSFSSMASDSTQYLFGNYSSPNRAYNPPSDFESEIENESSNFDSSPTGNNEVKRLNKLLGIYKNKFAQLKDAYAESETEKERIKVRGKIVSKKLIKLKLISFNSNRKF